MIRRSTRGKFVARNRTVSIAAWMAVLASAMLLGPLASHVSAQQQIDACVNNNTEVARFAPKPKKAPSGQTPGGGCTKKETEVTLDVPGPVGPSGPIGATGATGPQGVAGATGPQGPAGATGATGPQGIQGLAGATGPSGPAGSANAWSLTGNSGTTAGTNFVGTTDLQPLELHVNGFRVMRYAPAVENSNSDMGPNVIGGGVANTVSLGVQGATIAGGGGLFDSNQVPNLVQADFSTIGGGYGNTVNGGTGVSLDGAAATIAGGNGNVAGATGSPSGTGFFGTIEPGRGASVGGGLENEASGVVATVTGGFTNLAQGNGATVAGGEGNKATGDLSFAAGTDASAANTGAFVWSDTSGVAFGLNFPSIADNEFAARATGGVRFVTAFNGITGAPTAGVSLAAGGGSWSSISDRNAKANFAPVDGRKILKQLATIPIETWNYKSQQTSVRHMGPMAQDFHAAFKVGEDDKHITTIDADGVALATIQGLYQMLQAKDAQIAQLSARLEKLERETQAARDAAAMHQASALQPPRPSQVSRF